TCGRRSRAMSRGRDRTADPALPHPAPDSGPGAESLPTGRVLTGGQADPSDLLRYHAVAKWRSYRQSECPATELQRRTRFAAAATCRLRSLSAAENGNLRRSNLTSLR